MDTTKNIPSTPKVKKESKNKIRVEFERTPLAERLKAKFISTYFLQNVVWYVFRLVLLLGISFVILFPFFSKIMSSFMSPEDIVDVTVQYIPKNPTFEQYTAIFTENGYMQAFVNTLLLSVSCAIIQTFISCLVGYGLAKFKFRGNNLVFMAVLLTMIIPHGTLQFSLFMGFRNFDIFGIIKLITGSPVNLLNSFWPLLILSFCGLAFKNGLYIFMMRQFFRGVPDELEESAYVDGSGVFRTFIQIIIPLSVPMMITIFLFAFSWQWTDNFYTKLFFTTAQAKIMPNLARIPKSLATDYAGQSAYYSAIYGTCGLMIIAPLVVMYLFCQRYLIQGIERSGIVG
jgi:multiple sugar transport system permease protein